MYYEAFDSTAKASSFLASSQRDTLSLFLFGRLVFASKWSDVDGEAGQSSSLLVVVSCYDAYSAHAASAPRPSEETSFIKIFRLETFFLLVKNKLHLLFIEAERS